MMTRTEQEQGKTQDSNKICCGVCVGCSCENKKKDTKKDLCVRCGSEKDNPFRLCGQCWVKQYNKNLVGCNK